MLKNIIRVGAGLIGFALLMALIYFAFRSLPQPMASMNATSDIGATSNPDNTVTPQITEPFYPPPSTPLPTNTALPTVIFPTLEPEATVTSVITPFPTPAYKIVDGSVNKDTLATLWYPYLYDGNADLILQKIGVDNQGNRTENSTKEFNLGYKLNDRRSLNGLRELHPSPDGKFLTADILKGESSSIEILNLQELNLVTPYQINSGTFIGQFFSWSADSRSVLVYITDVLHGVLSSVDLETRKREDFHYLDWDKAPAIISAAAYSPIGGKIADGIIYNSVVGGNHPITLDIGLWKTGDFKSRISLCKVENATSVYQNEILWSPDGGKIAWVTTSMAGSKDDKWISLWIADLSTNNCDEITRLAENITTSVGKGAFNIDWSPDGKLLVFETVENVSEGDLSRTINLLDANSGKWTPIFKSPEGNITHLKFAPSGDKVAFSISRKSYGEIWIVNIDGSNAQALAGPTPIDASFVFAK